MNDYLKGKLDKYLSAAGYACGGPLGSLAGALVGTLLDSALDFIFTSCDGIVDVGSLAYPTGRELQDNVPC